MGRTTILIPDGLKARALKAARADTAVYRGRGPANLAKHHDRFLY